jgi:hypothetical protein
LAAVLGAVVENLLGPLAIPDNHRVGAAAENLLQVAGADNDMT